MIFDAILWILLLVAFDWVYFSWLDPFFDRYNETRVRWSETLHPRWIVSLAGLSFVALDQFVPGATYRFIGGALFFGSMAYGIYLKWRGRRRS